MKVRYVLNINELVRLLKTHGIASLTNAQLHGLPLTINLETKTVGLGEYEYELTTQPLNYGGVRWYFYCPECCARAYNLYAINNKRAFYTCSKCAKVHEYTLNRTKTDCTYYWELAVKEARKIDPTFNAKNQGYMFLERRFPSRPKRMKRTKYWRIYKRYMNYIAKGNKLWLS